MIKINFLCRLTCQSADMMSSLCVVGVRVTDFFSKAISARDVQFFKMKAYLLDMKSCSRHSDLFVCLFGICENVKILTQFHSFLIAAICSKSVFRLDTCRLLYIYMSSLVDALQGLILQNFLLPCFTPCVVR